MRYKRRILKTRLMSLGVLTALALSCIGNVYASTASNAKNTKDKAQSELDNANGTISDIEQKQTQLQAEIDGLDAELVNVLVSLGIVETELADKQVELTNVTADLAQAEEDEHTQYEAMKKRIKYMYENGDSGFMEAIAGSKDFGDLLNRVEYAQQVYGYDRKLLTSYQEIKQTVADLKVQVETEQAELEEVQQSYEEQKAGYESMIAQKQSKLTDFDTKLASAKDLAAQYTQTIAEQNNIIKQEEDKRLAEEKKKEDNKKNNGNSNKPGGGTGSTPDAGTGDGGANPPFATAINGSEVVSYACQFLGNPYEWGGSSLTEGADCSGFIMSVYAHYGISLQHSSAAMQSAGTAVSYANAQPGDIICYAGHVAIYMGGGRIVHASTPATGITTGSATYRTIITVRRVL